MKRTPLKKRGKKVRQWEDARAKLKALFLEKGVTCCELTELVGRRAECWRNNSLSFAHSKKRRNIIGDEIYEVVLACNICHSTIESKPESEMTQIVRDVIQKRGWKYEH